MEHKEHLLMELFEPSSILSSDWYEERLDSRLDYMKQFWENREAYLQEFIDNEANARASEDLEIKERIEFCREARAALDEPGTRRNLYGSLGREPKFQVS